MLSRFLRLGRPEAITTAVSQWLAGVSFGTIVVLVAMQVFCRYVLNRPLPWPEELASLLFISMTYLGALVVPAKRLHISVDFFYLLLLPIGRRLLDLMADLLAVIFFGTIVYGGFVMIDVLSLQRMPALQIPRSTVFLVVTVLAALQVCLHSISIIELVLGRQKKTEAEDEDFRLQTGAV